MHLQKLQHLTPTGIKYMPKVKHLAELRIKGCFHNVMQRSSFYPVLLKAVQSSQVMFRNRTPPCDFPKHLMFSGAYHDIFQSVLIFRDL